MRKSPKWNGRFRKLMENGRLIHKFFPIGSVCIEISTLFKSICMEISQFQIPFQSILGDYLILCTRLLLMCVFCSFCIETKQNSKYFGRCLSKLICMCSFQKYFVRYFSPRTKQCCRKYLEHQTPILKSTEQLFFELIFKTLLLSKKYYFQTLFDRVKK